MKHGISWTKLPVQFKSIAQSMIAYGNDTWCITNTDYMGSGNTVDCTVRYSTDKCETWKNLSIPGIPKNGLRCLSFGNEVFMFISTSDNVYVSRDAVIWNNIGTITVNSSGYKRFLCYGNGKWLAISGYGHVYISQNGATWSSVNSNLPTNEGDQGVTGCFVNGYFYITRNGKIMKSSDGTNWSDVIQCQAGYLTYYKNKLYAFGGNTCHIGFPNP